MDDRIDEGDIVDVWINDGAALCGATVLHIAQATGEAWRFRATDGKLHYIQQYQQIIRRDAKEGTP